MLWRAGERFELRLLTDEPVQFFVKPWIVSSLLDLAVLLPVPLEDDEKIAVVNNEGRKRFLPIWCTKKVFRIDWNVATRAPIVDSGSGILFARKRINPHMGFVINIAKETDITWRLRQSFSVTERVVIEDAH